MVSKRNAKILLLILSLQIQTAWAFTKEECEFFFLDRYTHGEQHPKFKWECENIQDRLDRTYADILKNRFSDLVPNTQRFLFRRLMQLSGCDPGCELPFLKARVTGVLSPVVKGRCVQDQEKLEHIYRGSTGKAFASLDLTTQRIMNFRVQDLEKLNVNEDWNCSDSREKQGNPKSASNLEELESTGAQVGSRLNSTPEDNEAITKSYKAFLKLAQPNVSLTPEEVRDIGLGMPSFMDRQERFNQFYSGAQLLGAGGAAMVYKSYMAFDRPIAGIRKGNPIAIRIKIAALDTEQSRVMTLPYANWNPALMAKLSALGTAHGMKVTDYFPEFYGAYYGRSAPFTNLNHKQMALSSDSTLPVPIIYLYQEMELVDTDFEKEYEHKKIPDSVVFEMCFGEWASQRILGIEVNDFKDRNIGLKKVDYYRVYRIGRDIYVFPPGMTPRRLDIDMFDRRKESNPNCTRFLSAWESDEAKQVAKDPNMFHGFSTHFTKYKITQEELDRLKADHKVREYQLDRQYLP
jgi:hypothetical protein